MADWLLVEGEQGADRWVALALSLLSLGLYVFTAAPDVLGGDSGEFQFVPPLLGIAHHTGYPLYTLLGKAWSLLPLGTLAYRMNLFSAPFAAATLGFCYLIVRELKGNRMGALTAVLALGASSFFWAWATRAGVRSSTAFFAALVIYLALRWARAVGAGRQAHGQLFLLGLANGAALAHHRSAAFLLAALLAFLGLVGGRSLWNRASLAAGGLGLAAPLSLYLYLPIRAAMRPAFDQFRPDTVEGFLNLVLAGPYSVSLLSFQAQAMPSRLAVLGGHLLGQFGWVGLALAALGAAALLAKNPRVFLMLALFLAGMLAHTLVWNQGDVQDNVAKYLTSGYLVLALWAGMGAAALVYGVFIYTGRIVRRPAAALVPLLMGTILAISLPYYGWAHYAANQAAANRPLDVFRQDLSGGQLARRLVLTSLPYVADNGVIIADWEQATAYWYFQLVEGVKPGVTISYPSDWEGEMARAGGRPVYLVRKAPAMAGKKLSMEGSLVRVADVPQRQPPSDLAPLGANLGGKLELLGYIFLDRMGRRGPSYDPQGDVLSFLLYWQALAKMEDDYSVSVRLLDQGGRLAAQYDNRHPVLSGYPTTAWDLGEVVSDYYELPLRSLPPGTYSLEVVVYRTTAEGWQDLPLLAPADLRGRQGVTLVPDIRR